MTVERMIKHLYKLRKCLYHLTMRTIAENSSINTFPGGLQSESEILSLQIYSLERIPARNCLLAFLKYHQLTQHG